MAAVFEWPALYNFPPFFTLQVVEASRVQQLKVWRELIQNYCLAHKKPILDVNEDADSALFSNSNLVFNGSPMPRKLSREDIVTVLDSVASQGYGAWVDDKHKSKFLVSGQKTISDWAEALHNWASEAGLFNDVFTLYGLNKGEDARGAPFVGLDVRIMHRAVLLLQANGKAVVVPGEELNEVGVKFVDAK